MKVVVKGVNPYKLAPGAHTVEPGEDSGEKATGAAAGTVYRSVRGQVKLLEGGMDENGAVAARKAARLGQKKAASSHRDIRAVRGRETGAMSGHDVFLRTFFE
jgi:ATP-binding cassette subfamily F protein 3